MTLIRFHRFVETMLDDLESGIVPDPKVVAMTRGYWNEAKDAIANETGGES